MRLSLYSVLVSFFTAFTSAAVKVESNNVGERDHSLDGSASDHHLLFQADVSTKLACATACTKYETCVAFSTTPKGPSSSKKMTCRAHHSACILHSDRVTAAGSKTYFINNRLPATTRQNCPFQSDSDCPSKVDNVECSAGHCVCKSGYYYSNSSNNCVPDTWLKQSCDDDDECPSTVANVECFDGKCLCTPGYYYSNCSDSCVPECAAENLQSTFLYYPNHYIPGYNGIVINNCSTFEQGLPHCLSTTKCRTLELYIGKNECHLQIVTALTPGVDWRFSSNGDGQTYQRTCL